MPTPLMRGGKIVASPLDGRDYDLKKLSSSETVQLQDLTRKLQSGSKMTGQDMSALVHLRRTCSTPAKEPKLAPTYEESMAKLKASRQDAALSEISRRLRDLQRVCAGG